MNIYLLFLLTGRDYVYDGNPHNFGSTHPKYVNYNSDNLNNMIDNNNIDINNDNLNSEKSESYIFFSNLLNSSNNKNKLDNDIYNNINNDIKPIQYNEAFSTSTSQFMTMQQSQHSQSSLLSLSNSKKNSNQLSYKKIISRPFVFNKKEIMDIIDNVLNENNIQLDDDE